MSNYQKHIKHFKILGKN